MTGTLDRSKLRKLLALMGSDHDGEALSAARRAHAMIAKSGIGWEEIIPDAAATGSKEAPPHLQEDRMQLDELIASPRVSPVLKIRLRTLRSALRAGRIADDDRLFIRLLHRKAVLDGAFVDS